ncbi:hypothetical protein PoB_005781800 [Plakobranchus ocellatus]|uniref:Uncharacterized protein n=1 Tax=Plakobranchus ocellatus TaxID=259542 RepID=A0AAV4CH86_9GAST|nr:hypothetical protein PoB_005781800 [Plakobranchus ocellatus]
MVSNFTDHQTLGWQEVPSDHLLIETHAPYVSTTVRGTGNISHHKCGCRCYSNCRFFKGADGGVVKLSELECIVVILLVQQWCLHTPYIPFSSTLSLLFHLCVCCPSACDLGH